MLYKFLVRSRIDYGLAAYGTASRPLLTKIDISSRSILILILGYLEARVEPMLTRRKLISPKFLIELAHHRNNSS